MGEGEEERRTDVDDGQERRETSCGESKMTSKALFDMETTITVRYNQADHKK